MSRPQAAGPIRLAEVDGMILVEDATGVVLSRVHFTTDGSGPIDRDAALAAARGIAQMLAGPDVEIVGPETRRLSS